MTGLGVVPLWCMNFGPPGKDGHGKDDLTTEVTKLCNFPRGERQSKLGFVTEGAGWGVLPRVPGHQVIHHRDGDNPAVANVGLYVAHGLDVQHVEYIQHQEGWSRVEHPGRHDPRVTLKARIRGDDKRVVLAVATHGPDPRADNPEAKREWVRIMVDIIKASDVPVLMGGDPNHLFPAVFERLGNPKIVRTPDKWPADAVLARGYVFTSADKVASVGGHRFTNDHRGALIGRAVAR